MASDRRMTTDSGNAGLLGGVPSSFTADAPSSVPAVEDESEASGVVPAAVDAPLTLSGDGALDVWSALRRHTPARIGLGRTGGSLPTGPALAFALAHAQARDAVHAALDSEAVTAEITAMGQRAITVQSAAPDRQTYLHRPDLGRRLSDESAQRLRATAAAPTAPASRPDGDEPSDHHPADAEADPNADADPNAKAKADVVTDTDPNADTDTDTHTDAVFVIADGLSARAAVHALDVWRALQPLLDGWRLAPVVIALQARVALGDAIAAALNARQVIVAIGERPGLSSPDSLGLYLTHAPVPGRTTDAERNCISNVRPDGLPCATAAARLAWLMKEARRRRLTGVELKDDSTVPAIAPG